MRRRYFLAAGFAGVGASVLGCPFVSADSGAFPFTHGVASGDPDQRGFLAWTRHIPRCDGPTTLVAEVAERENFEKVLLRQEVIAAPWHDYCVTSRFKNLEPGRWYYYRFRGPDGSISPIGRSRTLPRGPTDRFRVAVVGCSNATSGWFNAYAHLAERDDIDLVVHLGDYIYESALTRSDAIPGLARKRAIQPVHKCASLNDYRLRYASYRSDPDLARLHQRFPFIVMMDDHESANNAWHGGADGHNAVSEGRWHLRMDAALKAFHEWLPVNPGLYNRFDVGDLASLIRLETRLLGRTRKIELPHGLTEPEGRGNGLRRALSTFRREIDDPHRTMLGREQEDWLDRQLQSSVSEGVGWQILAQQVIMAERIFPPRAMAWFAKGIAQTPARSRHWEEHLPILKRLSEAGLPWRRDAWDGYRAARGRLFDGARKAGANLVILSGDSHNSWAFDLVEKEVPVGVELSTPSVSSFGFDKRITGDFNQMARDFEAANPHLKWCDLSQRGFLLIDIQRQNITAQWHFVPSGTIRTRTASLGKTLVTYHGSNTLSPA